MKKVSRIFTLLFLAVLPFSMIAQNPTVVLEYMKVTQESEDTYLEVEQAWKKIHQKRIDEGLCVGWQLWRNVYAGYNDPYQYIVVNWYSDYAQSFKPAPEGFYANLMNGEDAEIFGKTGESRVLASMQVSHRISEAENSLDAPLIFVNQMHVKQGMGTEYVNMELEVFKPIHEEAIKRGQRSHWGIWSNWPIKEGQAAYVTVDGYENAAQLTATFDDDLFSAVHPDLSSEETFEKINKLRKLSGAELWELVDQVMPEQ